MRHGGGGGQGFEVVPTGVPHAGAGTVIAAFGLLGALICMPVQAPRTFVKVVIVALVCAPLMPPNPLDSSVACWLVLVLGAWLSRSLVRERRARTAQKGTRT